MSVTSINEPASSVLVSHTPQSINEPSATAPPPDVEGPPIEPPVEIEEPPVEIEEPPIEPSKHHAVDPDDLEEEIEEAAGTDDFVTLHRGRPTRTLPSKRKK